MTHRHSVYVWVYILSKYLNYDNIWVNILSEALPQVV
jgi:hypothetical protein